MEQERAKSRPSVELWVGIIVSPARYRWSWLSTSTHRTGTDAIGRTATISTWSLPCRGRRSARRRRGAGGRSGRRRSGPSSSSARCARDARRYIAGMCGSSARPSFLAVRLVVGQVRAELQVADVPRGTAQRGRRQGQRRGGQAPSAARQADEVAAHADCGGTAAASCGSPRSRRSRCTTRSATGARASATITVPSENSTSKHGRSVITSVAATTRVGRPSAPISWSPTAHRAHRRPAGRGGQRGVERQRLADTGTCRDDDHLAGVQAVGQLVEVGEARRDAAARCHRATRSRRSRPWSAGAGPPGPRSPRSCGGR